MTDQLQSSFSKLKDLQKVSMTAIHCTYSHVWHNMYVAMCYTCDFIDGRNMKKSIVS